ncbi:unnamed protein product [Lathyrus oleraceus]
MSKSWCNLVMNVVSLNMGKLLETRIDHIISSVSFLIYLMMENMFIGGREIFMKSMLSALLNHFLSFLNALSSIISPNNKVELAYKEHEYFESFTSLLDNDVKQYRRQWWWRVLKRLLCLLGDGSASNQKASLTLFLFDF